MNNSKSWYKSKTILVNLIGVAVVVLQMVLGAHLLGDPQYQALVLAVLNVLLRFHTNTAVKL